MTVCGAGLTLNEMDAASGAVRVVYTETGHTHLDTNVSVLGLPNVRVLDRAGSFVWFSQRDGWGHLYLHDLATGALRNRITAGEWLVRDLLSVDEEAGTVEFLAAGIDPHRQPRYHRTLCRVRLDGTGLTVLTPGTDDHALAMPLHRAPRDHIRPPQDQGEWRAPSGRFFVHTHSDLTTLPVSELRRADGTLVAELARAELDMPWRAPEPFRVLADDGQTELWGAVWLPTDFDPAKRYPVIDYIYPGPQRGMTPTVMFTDYMPELSRSCMPQAWAELGFAVVNVDGRGVPLRSKAFQDTSYGKLDDPGTLRRPRGGAAPTGGAARLVRHFPGGNHGPFRRRLRLRAGHAGVSGGVPRRGRHRGESRPARLLLCLDGEIHGCGTRPERRQERPGRGRPIRPWRPGCAASCCWRTATWTTTSTRR